MEMTNDTLLGMIILGIVLVIGEMGIGWCWYFFFKEIFDRFDRNEEDK